MNYFSLSGITPLARVPRGGKIHVIGVCGVAMAQLALELARQGFQVSGSDKEFYEPMGSLLAASSVRLCRGYAAENVPADAALVVIGNAVQATHVEVLRAAELKLSYTIFPQLLRELVIADRHSVAVCGTHGKSTTSALMAATLRRCGLDPSYFIGGVVKDLPASLAIGSGQISVVEGDEYDSAFFAKVPKFSFYKPDTAIVTSIEYDHADIYPNLEAIVEQFYKLAAALPKEGRLVCCLDDKNVAALAAVWRSSLKCKVITYGAAAEADYRILSAEQSGRQQKVVVRRAQEEFEFTVPLPGLYNANNALAVVIAALELGVSREKLFAALAQFEGVKRRQDVRFDGWCTLVEDFAHHPTAVRETLAGVRQWFPSARIWAVFEPRSNTSRRKIFQDEYARAFSAADQVLLCNVTARALDASEVLMDVAELGQQIKTSGQACETLPDAGSIFENLAARVQPGDVILIMSNGSFGGLVGRFEEYLRAHDKS